MMDAPTPTRRTFVCSATAVAALLWPLASAARHMSSDGAGTTEAERWSAAIGRTVRLSGAGGSMHGTLVEVVIERHDPARPAAVRPQAFWAHFTFDAADAPDGEAIYALDRPIAGHSELFLTRSPDQAGRAVLKALFN